MKLVSKQMALLAALAMTATVGLSACAENEAAVDDSQDDAVVTQEEDGGDEEVGAVAANSRPDECGLQEQAGPEASFGPFDGAIAYFQPGEMADNPDSSMKMLSYAASQMHLELDLKANAYATNWGYAMDETPANLPIMFQLSDSDGNELTSGMMTPMNAIDGSHYGTNLPKDTIKEAGNYMMTITIYPPKDYDLHKDYITGVPADGWFSPLTVNMPWELSEENLEIVANNIVDDPMEIPEACKDYPVNLYEDSTAEKAMMEAESLEPLEMN